MGTKKADVSTSLAYSLASPKPASSPLSAPSKRTIFGCVGAGFLALLSFASACSSESNPTDMGSKADMLSAATTDIGATSCCGQPGDTGNAIGVGKYCTKDSMCPSTAPFCSYAHQPERMTFFCLQVCSGPDDKTTCGAGATCVKDPNAPLPGCVPDSCLTNKPPGCS